jgi:hypothetical protein
MPSHAAAFCCAEGPDASPRPARPRTDRVGEGIARIRRAVPARPSRLEGRDCPPASPGESSRADVREEGLERVTSALFGSPRRLRHRTRADRGRMPTHGA